MMSEFGHVLVWELRLTIYAILCTYIAGSLSRKSLTTILGLCMKRSMSTIMINIRIDPRLKKAIEKLANKQGINLSAIIRQTMAKHLQEHGIDWTEEEPD